MSQLLKNCAWHGWWWRWLRRGQTYREDHQPAIKPSDKSVETLLQNGVPVRLDQASNSNVVKKRSRSNGQPAIYGGCSTGSKTAQNEGLNRAVARTMGSDANKSPTKRWAPFVTNSDRSSPTCLLATR